VESILRRFFRNCRRRCRGFCGYGRGEITFLELLDAIENKTGYGGISGIAHKDGGKITSTGARHLIENLDILPFPARDLMPHSLYSPPPTKRVSVFKATSLTSARGCHTVVIFAARVVWTRRYRHRSPGNVIAEMSIA